jgi:hypothetical protein
MPKWIKPARVRAAISGLFEWRGRAKSQAAMHLWPLLALIEKGVNPKGRVKFTEQDDRAFWNRYGRLSGETRQPTGSAPFRTTTSSHFTSSSSPPITRIAVRHPFVTGRFSTHGAPPNSSRQPRSGRLAPITPRSSRRRFSRAAG